MKKFMKEKKYLLPFIFLVTLYPLIVFARVDELVGDFYKNWDGSRFGIDFFTHYKKIALLITVSLLLVMCLVRIIEEKESIERIKKMKLIFISSTSYIILIFASAIFSHNRAVAFKGFVQSNQGAFVQAAYVIVFLSAILLIRDLKDIRTIIKAFFVGAIVMSIFGILQYFKMDFFQTEMGNKIITSTIKGFDIDKSAVTISDIVYGTVFHKDYLGSYYALVIPMAFGVSLFAENIKERLFSIGVFLISFVTLIMCESRGGLGGAVIGIFVMSLIFVIKSMRINKKKSIALLLAVTLIGVIGINVGGKFNKSIEHINDNIAQLFVKDSSFDINDATPLNKVIVNEDSAGFKYRGMTFIFKTVDGVLKIYDENNNELTYEVREANVIKLDDEKFKDLKLQIVTARDLLYLAARIEQVNFLYEITANKLRLVDNKYQYVTDDTVEKWGFNGKELIFTMRGYIWSRSIPLLKKSVILGYGADTYTINFPQQDYIGKLHSYNDMTHIVDKPHNMFLQIALDNGILALIMFLIILFTALSNCFRKGNNHLTYLMVSGISAYAVTGIINDNRISVAPMFFLILGCCCVVNNLNDGKKTIKKGRV